MHFSAHRSIMLQRFHHLSNSFHFSFILLLLIQNVIGSILKQSSVINLNGSKTELEYMHEMTNGVRYTLSSFPSLMKISDFTVSCQSLNISSDIFPVPTWGCDNIIVNNKYRLPFGYLGNPRSEISTNSKDEILNQLSCGIPDPFHEMDALCTAMLNSLGASKIKTYFSMISDSSCKKFSHGIIYSRFQNETNQKQSYGWLIRNHEIIGYTISLRCGALIFE